MGNTHLDKLDNEIIQLLTKNGRIPVGEMAKKLNVTSPTIRSRIKNLEKKGLLKVSGIIDPNQHPQMTTALVAMKSPACPMWSGQESAPGATILLLKWLLWEGRPNYINLLLRRFSKWVM
jgi:DNA-binding Lrp family transcriptional regulator